jgi:four helix bundle protein
MRNSKSQNPKSKQIPNSKFQAEALVDGWHSAVSYPTATANIFVLNETSESVPERPVFDFQERTAVFGESVVRFAKKVPRNPTNDRLIDQVVGAATSVGANFCEASDSMSKKDFRCSAKRCLKEAKETRFFLRMIATSEPRLADEARGLYREATELIRILGSMCR